MAIHSSRWAKPHCASPPSQSCAWLAHCWPSRQVTRALKPEALGLHLPASPSLELGLREMMLHQELGPHGWSQRPGVFIDRGLIPCRGKWPGAGSLEGSPGPRSPDQSGHCSLPHCPHPHTGILAVQCPIDGLVGHAKTELQNFGVMARPVGGQLQCTQTPRAAA